MARRVCIVTCVARMWSAVAGAILRVIMPKRRVKLRLVRGCRTGASLASWGRYSGQEPATEVASSVQANASTSSVSRKLRVGGIRHGARFKGRECPGTAPS